jgi:hypothetical protein
MPIYTVVKISSSRVASKREPVMEEPMEDVDIGVASSLPKPSFAVSTRETLPLGDVSSNPSRTPTPTGKNVL